MSDTGAQQEAHKRRLAWMPWLWDRLKPHQRIWAEPWQTALQAQLAAVERVCFRCKPGTVQGPVASDEGFHIILVEKSRSEEE